MINLIATAAAAGHRSYGMMPSSFCEAKLADPTNKYGVFPALCEGGWITQLTGLVADNRKLTGPALAKLERTLKILRANQRGLDQTFHLAAPFVRDFTDTLGNGRWFETTLTNLTNSAGKLTLGNSGNR